MTHVHVDQLITMLQNLFPSEEKLYIIIYNYFD